MIYFVYIFPNFRYYGNKGWFESFFACTVKTTHPENTPQSRLHIIFVTSCVMANFVFKFVTFRYCVNKGQCAKTWITVKLIDLQNTSVVHKIWDLSYIWAHLL